jgi:hypothetical protein
MEYYYVTIVVGNNGLTIILSSLHFFNSIPPGQSGLPNPWALLLPVIPTTNTPEPLLPLRLTNFVDTLTEKNVKKN